jgi:hypothetical protein
LVVAPAKSEKDPEMRPPPVRLRLPKQATQPDSNDQFLAGAGKRQRILSSVFAQQFRHVKRRNLFERPAVEGDSLVPALMPAFGFCWPKARLDAASTSPAKPIIGLRAGASSVEGRQS